jgi:hypothetical protein
MHEYVVPRSIPKIFFDAMVMSPLLSARTTTGGRCRFRGDRDFHEPKDVRFEMTDDPRTAPEASTDDSSNAAVLVWDLSCYGCQSAMLLRVEPRSGANVVPVEAVSIENVAHLVSVTR